MSLRLVSSRILPEVELIRWILGRRGVAFIEEAHVLGLTGAVVPSLITEGGETRRGLRAILEGLEGTAGPPLYADDAERALVAALVDGLSGQVVRLVYPGVLARPRAVAPTALHRAPWWEQRFVTGLYPVWRLLFAGPLDANPAQASEAAALVSAALSRIDAELAARGAPFLGGDSPGTADIVLAALAGPIAGPPSYGARLPAQEDLSAETRALIAATRARPAGQLILRTYQSARHPPA